MTRLARPWLASLVASCVGLAPLACTPDEGEQTSVATAPGTVTDTETDSTTSGDGDGDASGDGDGDEEGCVGVVPIANEPPDMGDGDGDATGDGDGDATGDGDGDATTGDGDGDATTGDGDGDATTGDGDGDATTGDGDGDTGEPPCEDCAPTWRLWDFQPQSCGYDQYYGLDSFEGHVTLVALLAGWCSYCQGQAQRMDQLRLELRNEGYEVQMIAINGTTADNDDDRQKLVDRCSFPLFQDASGQNAWTLQGGSKDDMFVYRADGTLFAALPNGGEVPTNLGTEEGYDAVKQQLIDASE